ncbi:1847_t:CDS:2 [Acaulospora morrowiae]|uniref:m7GpppX diphosphatase n=1 Tax=Acaulospora morrowiae TaxID=94023 RepID=A0A9N9FN18_9GLOM|nr:1847_t:CDS:2 [Acaulospora morrowiae]
MSAADQGTVETTINRAPTSEELKKFKFVRLLSEDPRTKTAAILGTLGFQSHDSVSHDAVILLEKLHFGTDEFEMFTHDRVSQYNQLDKNDVYHWYNILLNKNEKWPDAKVTLIWPATETHIKKYSFQQRFLVCETPEIYEKVVKPHIDSIPQSRIQWVYNILSKQSESEKLILEVEGEDKGFILLPDMKWDNKTLESLYLQVIVHRRDVRSLRDLNETHLPLLKNLRQKVLENVPKRYPGVGADELRLFVHYQPSYYHFHVHIMHIRNDSIAGGIAIAKAFLLDDIIENIEKFAGDYYQRCNLTYIMGQNDALFSKLNDAGARVNPDC